jgi:hypothetical protein
MSYKEDLADVIKKELGLLFGTPTLRNHSIFASAKNLDLAAINWLVLEVESYTAIITTRKCVFGAVRRTLLNDQILDVDLGLMVSGGITEPMMILKVQVTVTGSTCLLRLNDLTTHINGEARGRVVSASGSFKLERAPSASPPSAPSKGEPTYYDYEEIPV